MTTDPIDYLQDLHQLPPLNPSINVPQRDNRPLESQQLLPSSKRNEPHLFIGGHYLPISRAEGHSITLGSSGSGKSKLNYPAFGFAASTLSSGNGLLVTFDPKGDMLPMAHHFAKKQNVPLYYFNITDPRSNVWDVASDINGYGDLLQELISILIPVPANTDPFWVQGAQSIAFAVGQALQKTYGNNWGFHDLYNACFSDLEKLINFLRRCPQNSATIERILQSDSEKTVAGILMQLSTSLQSMKLLAAHQYHTNPNRWVSLKQIVDTGGIVVIGQKQTSRNATTPMMRAIFKRLADLILDLPEYQHPNSYIFIDELAYMGRELPGLIDLLTFSRSKNAHLYLTIQNIDQLREAYGVHGAETIVSNCEFITLLRSASVSHSNWCSQLCGQYRTFQASYGQGGSFSESLSYVEKARFIPDDFRTLPRATRETGIHSVFISPYTGVSRSYLSGDKVARLQPPVSNIPARMEKEPHEYDLPNWSLENVCMDAMSIGVNKEEFIRAGKTPLEETIREYVFTQFERGFDAVLQQKRLN